MATHEMQLSATELLKLLFKRKNCPRCGVKMVRIKKQTNQGAGWHRDKNAEGHRVEYGQKYDYSYEYRCDGCATSVALRDL